MTRRSEFNDNKTACWRLLSESAPHEANPDSELSRPHHSHCMCRLATAGNASAVLTRCQVLRSPNSLVLAGRGTLDQSQCQSPILNVTQNTMSTVFGTPERLPGSPSVNGKLRSVFTM